MRLFMSSTYSLNNLPAKPATPEKLFVAQLGGREAVQHVELLHVGRRLVVHVFCIGSAPHHIPEQQMFVVVELSEFETRCALKPKPPTVVSSRKEQRVLQWFVQGRQHADFSI